MSYKEKILNAGENKFILSVWDLGGQGDNVNMLPLVANDANAILFLFDLNRKQTLIGVKEWYRQARVYSGSAPAFLVGTKFDQFAASDPETISSMTKLAKKFAKAMKAPLVFVSAKDSINVNKLFKIILAKVFNSDCNVQEIKNTGEPLILYKDLNFD